MADLFTNITFDEETHTYQYNNKRADISVTGLIHQYSQEFDEEATAERVANKKKVSVQEILDEWHDKRDYSCIKGNEIHKFAQGLWKGEEYTTDYTTIETRFIEQLKADLKVLKPQAIAFYEEYHDMLELVKDEQYIYDEDYDIAGSIDLLCKNKYTSEYVIADFKSNDNFYKKAYGNMKVPLHELEDSNLSHYSLQLEIYKHIFEKNIGEKVEATFIVHFDLEADNYTIIEPLNVKKEVRKILENRRVKGFMENDKSIVILVIGKSGAGKSASLRNFTNEEIGIINVLGKELPFRNNLKTVKTDNYDVILNGVKNSTKKRVVIDDGNYLITREFVRKASLTGYQKFTDMACNFDELIEGKQDTKGVQIKDGLKDVKGCKTIYIFMHEDYDDNNNIVPKTIGKMLDEKINIQGLFTIVVRAVNDNGNYKFLLKSNGQDCVKTPIGMFDKDEMDNDLKELDRVIREYYELDKIEEVKEEEKK